MANVDLFSRHGHTPRRIGTPFFNVDADVGPILFGAYRNTDVQLVQTLLQIIDSNTPVMNPTGAPPPPKPAKKLAVDRGIFGPDTKAWVDWFQLAAGLVRDSQVSHAPRGRSRGTISGLVYTIIMMNDIASAADFNRHFGIMSDPRVPLTLRNDLNRGRK